MSEISKIQVQGVDYDLKDAVSRASIGDLSALPTEQKADLVSAISELANGENGSSCGITYIESTTDNPVSLRELASGTYVLYGRFIPYSGSTRTLSFSSNLLVNIITKTAGTHVQVFYPVNNVVQFLDITDDDYERTDVYLNDLKANLEMLETTVSEIHTHENKDVLDGITSSKVAEWDAKEIQGDPGYTPVRGVDYWTEEDQVAVKAEVNGIVAEELAKRGQLKPEFANAIGECTDTAKLYVLPDGQIYAYILTEVEGEESTFGTVTWDSFSVLSTTENAYVFNHIGATLTGKLKSISVKCNGPAVVKFAVAHMSDGIVTSVDDITITTKAGENTYVNGVDFVYDGTIQEGDLIGYCRDANCGIYYGDSTQWCYKTASLTDYTLTQKSYGFAISAVVATESVEGYAWGDTGHAFVPADYEDRIVDLENGSAEHSETIGALTADVTALKEGGAKAALPVIGTEIDPGIADYADSEGFVIKLKPSAMNVTLTMEKSETTNTSAVRQVCFVDFAGGKIGFYTKAADGAALTVYQEKDIGFELISGHEFVVEMIKKDSKYAILRITDAYSLDSDEISCSEFAVGRGWGARKYAYTGNEGDILSAKSYVQQNRKTKLLIVGDSYIEGSSLPENGEDRDGRYAMRMKDALGGDCFINGRGGAASADVLGWFDSYLTDVCQPEHVIVSCGANDGNYDNWVARMEAIIGKIEEMGAKPILTTIAALSVGACKDIWQQQNAWIRSSGYDFIDINLVTSLNYGMAQIDPALFFADNVHPNTAGHEIIFKRARLDVPYLFV